MQKKFNSRIAIFEYKFPNIVRPYVLDQLIYLIKNGFCIDLYASLKQNSEIIQGDIKKFELDSLVEYIDRYSLKNKSLRIFLKYFSSKQLFLLLIDIGKICLNKKYGLKYFFKSIIFFGKYNKTLLRHTMVENQKTLVLFLRIS